MKEYVIFGAGMMAETAIKLLGKERIEYIVDNDRSKSGKLLDDIRVFAYTEKMHVLGKYTIIIAVSEKYCDEIEQQLLL